ncbi:hypothetical protein MASR1M36_16020 [Candidatus Cloacimonadaceae bacterium]
MPAGISQRSNKELLRNNNQLDKIMHKRKRNEAEDDANKQRNKAILSIATSSSVPLAHEAKLWLSRVKIPGAGENDLLSLRVPH